MDNLLLLVDAPSILAQLVIDGLLVGALFAIPAFGLALVWGVMNIINIAQGEFVILGGYVTWYLVEATGLHPLLLAPLAGVALYLLGLALYHVVIFRIIERDLFTSLLATFGISILMQQLMNELFGADVVSSDPGLGSTFIFDGQVVVALIKVVGFVAAQVVGGLLALLLLKSRLGQSIRATAQNARAARILGIDTHRVYAQTFALNAALCGLAGSLVVMTWVIHPFIGLVYTVRSFMIVIIAGLGNLLGVVLSGLGLGALENTAGFVLGAEFQSAFVFSLLVVILVVRNLLLRRQRKYLN